MISHFSNVDLRNGISSTQKIIFPNLHFLMSLLIRQLYEHIFIFSKDYKKSIRFLNYCKSKCNGGCQGPKATLHTRGGDWIKSNKRIKTLPDTETKWWFPSTKQVKSLRNWKGPPPAHEWVKTRNTELRKPWAKVVSGLEKGKNPRVKWWI